MEDEFTTLELEPNVHVQRHLSIVEVRTQLLIVTHPIAHHEALVPLEILKRAFKGEIWEEWALTYGRNGSSERKTPERRHTLVWRRASSTPWRL